MGSNTSGVLVALIFWGFVLGVSILPVYFRYRERKNLHETVRTIIASGGSPSDELMKMLQAPQKASSMPSGEKAVATGIIICCVALGIMGFGAVLAYVLWYNDLGGGLIAGPIIMAGGLFVGMIGVAFLMIGKRTRKLTSTDTF